MYLFIKERWNLAVLFFSINSCLLTIYSYTWFGHLSYSVFILLFYVLTVFIINASIIRPLFCLLLVILSLVYSWYHTEYVGPTHIQHIHPYMGLINICLSIVGIALYSRIYIRILVSSTKRSRTAYEKLKITNKSLLDQNKTIEDQNTELELFAFMASHDLKTPIRTVNSYLGLIEKNYKTAPKEKFDEYLKFAQSGVAKLNHLIEGILEFTRIRSSSDTFEPVDIYDAVEMIKKILNIDKNPNIYIVNKTKSFLNIDKTHLLHLLQNFVENGIKYNNSSVKKIILSEKLTSEGFQICIEDNGIGIDIKYAENIYKPFQKLHTDEEYNGTGIGLTICKKIIGLYGGTVSFRPNLQKGTMFYIDFPLSIVNK